MFIFEREGQSVSSGGAEREGDTEYEAGPRLWAVSTELNVGLKPVNYKIMTWAKAGHLTNWATQVPQKDFKGPGRYMRKKISSTKKLVTLRGSLHRAWCYQSVLYQGVS